MPSPSQVTAATTSCRQKPDGQPVAAGPLRAEAEQHCLSLVGRVCRGVDAAMLHPDSIYSTEAATRWLTCRLCRTNWKS
jgi:hypothetical protein